MKNTRVLTVALALLSLVSGAFAGSELRLGTSGAQELLLPIGARGYAMGGGVVGDVTGIEATFYNPAGLSRNEGVEVMFSNLPYIADIDVNFAGVATTLGDLGSLAFTAKVVSIGEIEETTEAQPEGTGIVNSPSLGVFGLTFSRQMTDRVNFGVTANYINERIFRVSANGMSFDLGFMYETGWQGMKIGMAVRNIGPGIRFDGGGFDLRSGSLGNRSVRSQNAISELPSNVVFGVCLTPTMEGQSRVTFNGNFQSNNFSEDVWVGGAEYAFQERFFVRGAYNYSVQSEYIYGLSAGVGARISLGETDVDIDAGWRQNDFFDEELMFTGKLHF